MTMTPRTARARRDDDREVRLIVAGEHGAIEYHGFTLEGQPLGIEYHHARPRWDGDDPHKCDVLEGPCYPDGTSMGAADVHREYVKAGCDVEVIWRDLESRYAEWSRKD